MAKTPGRDAVISQVLRSQRYQCARCDVPQHGMVVKNSNGSYMICDSFQQEYFKARGKTVFKIYLKLCFRDGDKENFAIENLFALCPACTQKFLRDLNKDFKAIALENKIGLNIGLVLQIKNFIMCKTGAEIGTRDCLALIDLLIQNHNYER